MRHIFTIFNFNLLLAHPSNLIASGIKSSREYPKFILNVTLFSILHRYILIVGLLVFFPCFFKYIKNRHNYLIQTPSGNSDFSFHVGADILILLFFYDVFIFSHVYSGPYLGFEFNFRFFLCPISNVKDNVWEWNGQAIYITEFPLHLWS